MNDLLLQLGSNPYARQLATRLGLPLPPQLRRDLGPWRERPLNGQRIVLGGSGDLRPVVLDDLAAAGASVHDGADPRLDLHRRPADRFVFDATGLLRPAHLHELYEFFQPRLRRLAESGRIVVLARPPEEQASPIAAATARAIEGFARSLAREVSRRGSTAHVVYVARGAEDRLGWLLRFLLSDRSAYMSGQPFHVSRAVAAPAQIPFVRPLAGKVALVTGAARGIGAAIAVTLAREGARVVGLDRPESADALTEIMDWVKGASILQDLSDPVAPHRIASRVLEKHGRLDVLVHNAGITRDRSLANMQEVSWDQVIGVNLTAVISLTTRLLEAGGLADEGRIVCLSSIAGIAGNFGQTNYAASKAGVIGYVEHLAPTVAERGIAVNSVAPGFIETRLTAAIPFVTRQAGRRLCNLSQGGLPEDVAEVVTFLASPGAAGLTGSVLRVCGGSLLGA